MTANYIAFQPRAMTSKILVMVEGGKFVIKLTILIMTIIPLVRWYKP